MTDQMVWNAEGNNTEKRVRDFVRTSTYAGTDGQT